MYLIKSSTVAHARIALHRQKDCTLCQRIANLVITEFFRFLCVFQQCIPKKDDTGLSAPRHIIGSLKLIKIHNHLRLETSVGADIHTPFIRILILFQHQKWFFRDFGKVHRTHRFIQKTPLQD